LLALVQTLLVQLPDDAPPEPKRGQEQNGAGNVFHAQEHAR
jgi:hypothetical protein